MTTFVLIHGAEDSAWSWHLVEAELRERGHDVVAVDLPSEDDSAGYPEYADAVIKAVGDRTELVVVGHSLGGFTAPLVADRTATKALVFVAGMIPKPGETTNEWWENTGYTKLPKYVPVEGEDEYAQFYHDVPAELAAEALKHGRAQSMTPMDKPWPLANWPQVTTKVLVGRDDRFMPEEFSRRVAEERLGVKTDVIGGGHCMPLSRPKELAERLERYATEA